MIDLFLNWLIQPGSLTSLMLILIFSFIFTVFINAQLRGRIDWLDLVCRSNTSIVSLSKVLQLVGGIVATWIVVKSTLLSNGDISWELFTAYLAYVGSVEAYGKYITLRYKGMDSGNIDSGDKIKPKRRSDFAIRRSATNPEISKDEMEESFDDNTQEARPGGAKTPE